MDETNFQDLLSAPVESQRRDYEAEEIAKAEIPFNSSFSKVNSNLQVAWDSTSLSALKTCPEYYNLSIRQGYTTHAESAHLTFGILVHSGKEMYDRLRAGGVNRDYYRNLRRFGVSKEVARQAVEDKLPHSSALLCVIRFLLCSTWDFKRRRPWISDEPTKNRETLIRGTIWYLDQFQNDPMTTLIRADGTPAVELSFRFDSGITSGLTNEDYIFCGHLDRVAVYHDKLWVSDIKTSKYAIDEKFFEKFSPENQMSMYSLAGSVVFHEPISGIMIDGWQTLATGARFQRGQVNRSPAQLNEWLIDTAFWLATAERFAAAEYWPRNDKSCGNYGGCPYRAVCGADPSVRPQILKTHYRQRVWDPLKTREV